VGPLRVAAAGSCRERGISSGDPLQTTTPGSCASMKPDVPEQCFSITTDTRV
jgi:hypothetical protein